MKNFKKGIYDSEHKHTIKIVGKLKGWSSTVLYFTNNPDYGKSYFGLEGQSLVNFMKEYKLRKK